MLSSRIAKSIVALAATLIITADIRAAECDFDTMSGPVSDALNLVNFNIRFATYLYPSCEPERNGSLPCEETARLNSPIPAYIQNTKKPNVSAYFDRFIFAGIVGNGSARLNGQAIVRRYEFLAMPAPGIARHLSFVLNGDSQTSFLTISQDLSTARPPGIGRKLPEGTTVALSVAPGANQTSRILIEFWDENGDSLGSPIDFSTSTPIQLTSLKRGNVVPMNFTGDGAVHFID